MAVFDRGEILSAPLDLAMGPNNEALARRWS